MKGTFEANRSHHGCSATTSELPTHHKRPAAAAGFNECQKALVHDKHRGSIHQCIIIRHGNSNTPTANYLISQICKAELVQSSQSSAKYNALIIDIEHFDTNIAVCIKYKNRNDHTLALGLASFCSVAEQGTTFFKVNTWLPPTTRTLQGMLRITRSHHSLQFHPPRSRI